MWFAVPRPLFRPLSRPADVVRPLRCPPAGTFRPLSGLLSVVLLFCFSSVFAGEVQQFVPAWRWSGSKAKYHMDRPDIKSDSNVLDKSPLLRITNFDRMSMTGLSISPDGKKAAFASFDGEYMQLFCVDTKTGATLSQLTQETDNSWMPVFSSNNDIIFVSDRSGMPKLWELNIGLKTVMQMTRDNAIDAVPDTAPGAMVIYYASLVPNTKEWAVCRVNRDGNNMGYLHKGYYPRVSMDGKKIAFLCRGSGEGEEGAAKYTQAWVMDNDGKNPLQLTALEANVTSLCWMNDGKKLIITSDRPADEEEDKKKRDLNLWLFDLETKAYYRITENVSEDAMPATARESKDVYFLSNRGDRWNIWEITNENIYQIDPPLLTKTLVTDGEITLEWQAVASASGYNVYFKPTDTKNWWKVNTDELHEPKYTIKDLKSGIKYDVGVSASDVTRQVESKMGMATLRTRSITDRPGTPTKVELKEEGDNVKLKWTPVGGAVSYNVYLAPKGYQGFKVNKSPLKKADFIFPKNSELLSPGVAYSLRVRSVDGRGGESEASKAVPLPGHGAAAEKKPADNEAAPAPADKDATGAGAPAGAPTGAGAPAQPAADEWGNTGGEW